MRRIALFSLLFLLPLSFVFGAVVSAEFGELPSVMIAGEQYTVYHNVSVINIANGSDFALVYNVSNANFNGTELSIPTCNWTKELKSYVCNYTAGVGKHTLTHVISVNEYMRPEQLDIILMVYSEKEIVATTTNNQFYGYSGGSGAGGGSSSGNKQITAVVEESVIPTEEVKTKPEPNVEPPKELPPKTDAWKPNTTWENSASTGVSLNETSVELPVKTEPDNTLIIVGVVLVILILGVGYVGLSSMKMRAED